MGAHLEGGQGVSLCEGHPRFPFCRSGLGLASEAMSLASPQFFLVNFPDITQLS